MSRRLAPCGTDSAYNRHLRLDEEPCRPCRDAHAEQARARTARAAAARPARELQPCGTDAAAQRHRKRGEPLCEACLEVARAKHRAYQRRISADPVRRAERQAKDRERRHRLGISKPRPEPRHGTDAARRRHRERFEPFCRECAESERPRQPLAPCGTEASWRRHRARGESCVECENRPRPPRWEQWELDRESGEFVPVGEPTVHGWTAPPAAATGRL